MSGYGHTFCITGPLCGESTRYQWTYFLHYWPFVWGIYQVPVDILSALLALCVGNLPGTSGHTFCITGPLCEESTRYQWTYFLHYWPFVWGIYQVPVDILSALLALCVGNLPGTSGHTFCITGPLCGESTRYQWTYFLYYWPFVWGIYQVPVDILSALLALCVWESTRYQWTYFLHYWPFVWGIYQVPVGSQYKESVMQSFDDFFVVGLYNL